MTTNETKRVPGSALVVLALLSAIGISFEITLTRLFSLFFQYHYVFLALSVAVLGLSLGAALAQIVLRRLPLLAQPMTWPLPVFLLSLFFLLLTWLMARQIAASVFFYALLALVPFWLIGYVMTLLWSYYASHSTTLYAVDLLGAGMGVIATFALLAVWSPFSQLLFLGLLLALTAGLAYRHGLAIANRFLAVGKEVGIDTTPRPHRYWAVGALAAALWLFNLFTNRIDYCATCVSEPPRDKTMLAILNDPARAARITQSAWHPFARVDVVETNDPTAKYVFADGGGGSYMLRYDGSAESVAWLRDLPEFIPFAALKPQTPLILGAGAGKDIVAAQLAGAQTITALEVNPAILALTRVDSDYNGGILDLPNVSTIVGDARTYVEHSQESFDLVYLNLVYTQVAKPASQALVENYIFTRQAFQAYLARLSDDGVIAIITHNALEGIRAGLTALAAKQADGIPVAQGVDHLALWMMPNADPTLRTSLLIVGRQPLSQEQLAALTAEAARLQLQPLFVPGQEELAFAPMRRGVSLEAFIEEDADYNLRPTVDDQPFFFNLDPGLPQPVRQALWISAFFALALTVLSYQRAPQFSILNAQFSILIFPALLGVGFMLVEITLIQRLQLLLGYPVLALATVLGSLLLASGLGSWWAGRHQTQLQKRMLLASLWVMGAMLIYWLVLPSLLSVLLPTSLALRWLATVLLSAVIGIPLGIPFPSFLGYISQENKQGQGDVIALFWSVNGVCSVLGSTLAVVLAMSWGYSVAMLLAAVLYGVVALLLFLSNITE